MTATTVVPTAPGRLPLIGHAVPLQRDPIRFLAQLGELGSVVQVHLGPLPVYVITRPELLHEILVTKADSFEKGQLFDKARHFLGNGIMTSGGAFHRRQRRLLQPAFHRQKISHYFTVMDEKAQELAESWKPGQKVELMRSLDELALAIVTATLFTTDLGRQAVDEIQKSLPIVVDGVTRRTLLPVDGLHRLPTPANRRFNNAHDRIREVIDQVITAYRADGTDHDDLLSLVLAARDAETGQGMTDLQVRDELVTLMLAGAETVGSSVGSVLHELGRHPDVQDRVRAELDRVLQGRPVAAEDLPKLEYTGRVLTEALRLHAPTWLLMRRTTADVTLGTTQLPAGSEVLFSISTLHRDPAVYDEPLAFDPDRWLRHSVKDLPRGAYLPFGEGARQCIGNTFAWAEMIVILAAILSRWNLTPAPGPDPKHLYRVISRLDHVTMTLTPHTALTQNS
ncbi:cytochrome P450 [Streptomyces sp. NPDC058371]|uniref:cytochrome P450 n=1 Tax=Streptomyces sp. NPDC058371 TaxID=3346463 RepID=UPI0036634901